MFRRGLVVMLVVVAATSVQAAHAQSGPPLTALRVMYPAGWNLLSGRAVLGLPCPDTAQQLCFGPVYTFQSGDSDYETVTVAAQVVLERGYWVYLDQPTTGSIARVSGAPETIQLPVAQWIMVGNPYDVPVSIDTAQGTTVAYMYVPAAGYQPADVLIPGQGAWLYAKTGGVVLVSPRHTSANHLSQRARRAMVREPWPSRSAVERNVS